MPIYEFVCTECSKSFEDLVFSLSKIDEVVCPACGSSQVKKKMSTFASKPAAGGEFVLAGCEFSIFVQHGKCLRGLIPISRGLISLIKVVQTSRRF